MNRRNYKKQGFTLAELLIVVAIIAVLVAVAIPVFSAQLKKARQAATIANLRSAYAEAMAQVMLYSGNGEADGDVSPTGEPNDYYVTVHNVKLMLSRDEFAGDNEFRSEQIEKMFPRYNEGGIVVDVDDFKAGDSVEMDYRITDGQVTEIEILSVN